jgi:hypothetical protein
MDLHPACKQMKKYGDPLAVADAVEKELRNVETIRNGAIFLTQNWIVIENTFGPEVRRVQEMVRVRRYKHVTKTSGITVSTYYYVSLDFSDNKNFKVILFGTEETADISRALKKRVPNLKLG